MISDYIKFLKTKRFPDISLIVIRKRIKWTFF